MNGQYIIFDTHSGFIKRNVQCPTKDIHVQVQAGEDFLYGTATYEDHYVNTSTRMVVDRPVMPVQHLGDHLFGVPKGAQIVIEGQEYEADGTTIELGFSHPGSYPITINKWPYLEWSTTVEVKA